MSYKNEEKKSPKKCENKKVHDFKKSIWVKAFINKTDIKEEIKDK